MGRGGRKDVRWEARQTPRVCRTRNSGWSPIRCDERLTAHWSSSTFAPLFNPWGEAYPYYLRETQRPALGYQVPAHLCRYDAPPPDQPDIAEYARTRHPSWFASAGAAEPTYVKRGDHGDLFDYGVSRGRANDLLQLIAGVGSPRPADVTLHGHVHRFNEFRIATVNGELAYFMDFYTHNPASDYPTRFPIGWPQSDVAFVEVVDSAPANSEPTEMPYEARHKYVVQVPPYARPLATAGTPVGGGSSTGRWCCRPRRWVLSRTGKSASQDFGCCRSKEDVIDKIHFIATQRLHERGYQLPWEEAIAPSPPRRYQHMQRSRQHNAPEAVSTPCGYLSPAAGMQNIVYRDARGRMIELWRDAAGRTGRAILRRRPTTRRLPPAIPTCMSNPQRARRGCFTAVSTATSTR